MPSSDYLYHDTYQNYNDFFHTFISLMFLFNQILIFVIVNSMAVLFVAFLSISVTVPEIHETCLLYARYLLVLIN